MRLSLKLSFATFQQDRFSHTETYQFIHAGVAHVLTKGHHLGVLSGRGSKRNNEIHSDRVFMLQNHSAFNAQEEGWGHRSPVLEEASEFCVAEG